MTDKQADKIEAIRDRVVEKYHQGISEIPGASNWKHNQRKS